MKTVLSFALLAISLGSAAQIKVDGVDINQVQGVKYITILANKTGVLNKKTEITIDYGQRQEPDKTRRVDGPDGRPRVFDGGYVEALNFFDKNGWEFHQNLSETTLMFLLKKKSE